MLGRCLSLHCVARFPRPVAPPTAVFRGMLFPPLIVAFTLFAAKPRWPLQCSTKVSLRPEGLREGREGGCSADFLVTSEEKPCVCLSAL